MAAPAQDFYHETTNTDHELEETSHRLPHREVLTRTKNGDFTTFELPERLLTSGHDSHEAENDKHVSEEPIEEVGVKLSIKEEEKTDHEGRREISFSREREISSSLPDDYDSVSTPANGKDRLPAYRPSLILRGHKKGVAAVKYSPDGRRIASCCMSHLFEAACIRAN